MKYVCVFPTVSLPLYYCVNVAVHVCQYIAVHLCQCVQERHAAWASVSPSLTNADVSHNMLCAPW